MMLVCRTESLVDLGTESVASDCYDNKCLELDVGTSKRQRWSEFMENLDTWHCHCTCFFG